MIFIKLCVLIILSSLTFVKQRSQEPRCPRDPARPRCADSNEDHSWRSETGVRTYSKKLRSASNVVIVIMQSGILPGNWHKFSGLGIYQSILNPAVLQICKIESEKIQQKSRSFWNEVSSNNAKSPFPGQLVESFRLGNISIYLKPWSSTNVKNWIFFHDPRFLYRFYPCVYSPEAWKKA